MKKLKQYNKEEVKALVVEYNDIVKIQRHTNELSMPYRITEAMVDQNYVRPYIQLWCNETKSGELERLYLDWDYKDEGNKMIKKYRIKKPIRAVLWNGKNERELRKLIGNNIFWLDGKIEMGYTSAEGIHTDILLEVGDMVFEVENDNHDCMEASKFNELYEEIK